jgi:3-oxoacyl-[acyl-carrier protein] reductase
MQMFSLDGKVALVTGATGGIGASVARTLHKAGASVILTGTNEEKLEAIYKELGGTRAHKLTANLSKPGEARQLIEAALEKLGQLDILVCNAGVTRDTLAIRMKDEDFDFVIDINLKSTFILNREALKHMMKRKAGRIINIASVVAFSGNPGQANYCASKAGIVGMSKSLAKEIASRGVTVNCIAPGFITTSMTESLTEEQKDQIKKFIPSARIGSPEDIAHATLYLASDEANYITGSTLHVNGGMFMN